MKRNLLFTILLTLFIFSIKAQNTFEKTYGGNVQTNFRSLLELNNGDIVSVGTYYGTKKEVYLVKTNNSGDTIWTKTYGSTNNDQQAFSLLATPDGGFALYGDIAYAVGPNWGDLLLIKTDSIGNLQWSKTYGGSDWEKAGGNANGGNNLCITSDKGFALLGHTYSFGILPYLVKTDSNGNQIWQQTYWGNSLNAIQPTSDNGFVLFGNYSNVLHLIKTNATGDTVWTKKFQGHVNARGLDVKITSDNGYILTGMVQPTVNNDIFLFKTSSNGDSIWFKTYGGTNTEWGLSLIKTNDDGYAITGYTNSFGFGNTDLYFIKTNFNGDTLFTRTYGGTLFDNGNFIRQSVDLGYIICGSSNSFSSNTRAYLIKTDSLGRILIPVGIMDASKNLMNEMEIYPNPFSSKTTIKIKRKVDNATITVYSAFGQKIKQINNVCGQTIFLTSDNLPIGMYYICLSQGNEIISTGKIVIIDN